MSKQDLQIPRPSFEEDTLIRESAPLPELSSGFRSRVLSECATTLAASRSAFRMKVAGSVAAVCCLSSLMALCIPVAPNQVLNPSVAVPAAPTLSNPAPSFSPTDYTPASSPGGSSLAVDSVRPRSNSDSSQMNEIIDDLTNRKNILKADMLPQF